MLHNFCIAKHDPCNPRWRLSVEKLELNTLLLKEERTKENQTRMLEKLLTDYGRSLT